MSERQTRSMYIIEGSAVRKVDSAPYREERPVRKPVHTERPVHREKTRHELELEKKASAKLDKALAFDMKYTFFVVASVFIMVFACVTMLYWESRIAAQKNNIHSLEAQLETMQADNAAYKMSIDNMYTLDEIFDTATNELGMVYAKKGQIVYYESADEDYVKQYQDVPDAN